MGSSAMRRPGPMPRSLLNREPAGKLEEHVRSPSITTGSKTFVRVIHWLG